MAPCAVAGQQLIQQKAIRKTNLKDLDFIMHYYARPSEKSMTSENFSSLCHQCCSGQFLPLGIAGGHVDFEHTHTFDIPSANALFKPPRT
jgi:hypothetical protein